MRKKLQSYYYIDEKKSRTCVMVVVLEELWGKISEGMETFKKRV